MTRDGGGMKGAQHLPAGSADRPGMPVEVSPESAGWQFCGLEVLTLTPGGQSIVDTGADEVIVVPLAGSCTVDSGGDGAVLSGRDSVFTGVTDVAYVPRGSRLCIASEGGGGFALCSARATRRLPFRYVPASSVPVELRGAGSCSRQVNNFGVPGVLEADRIIACEVLTPAGNWSSYPPHKHDEQHEDESALEEIYYFEVAGGGPAYLRAYGTQERPYQDLARVGSGDVVLIPHGWHGPAVAVPGHDLYYLNVMAGPGPRAWLIRDDPAHAWIRETWPGQPVDPRLPMTAAPTKEARR
jgi:5-deoxy-glucuronate isomerase